MSGIQIPGYELIEKIRECGTGTIWKAKQVLLDRTAVVQVLHSNGGEEDNRAMRDILDRTKQVAALKHSGIVPVLDVGEQDGTGYIVTEHINGSTAREKLKLKSPLNEKQILQIADQSAKALHYAWSKEHLLHGNLKPENIVIGDGGRIMISGLGLAGRGTVCDEATGECRESLLGTANYMSPEQAQGQTDLDCRTDIYSLGATLYHLATGKLPFADTPGTAAIDRHLQEQIPNPREVNPKISVGLTSLITKMMLKDPADRYGSWSEVSTAIKRIKSGRIYVQKQGRTAESTVASAHETVSSVTRQTPPKKSPILLIFRLMKWVAILALWALVAYEVFR